MKKAALPVMGLAMILFSFSLMANPVAKENNIQLAILLDTSNSMDGLINQAKTHLWKIVNELARTRKNGRRVNLEVALYEYGNDALNSREGYLRQVTTLTNDLDLLSEKLFELDTYGGSEFCGTVIKSAIEGLPWSNNGDDLKLIIIAGNEPFTQGQIDYRKSCRKAIGKGILVNTIFCGDYREGLNTSWKDGADIAEGEYINIDHNQEIVHIRCPQDDRLVDLGRKLNDTYVAYGEQGLKSKERQEMQDEHSLELNEAVMAQRSAAKASSYYKNSDWDLVDAEEESVVDFSQIDKDMLPVELQKKSPEELKKYVSDMREKRKEIQDEINKLNEERRKFLAEESLKTDNKGLDSAIINAIHKQANSKGFEIKE